MTDFIKLQTPDQSIQIGFTDQKVSGRAGPLSFAGFPHWHRLGALLARVLPQQRTSKKAIPVADLALGFLAAILDGAQKLVQVAHLRRDVMLPELLAMGSNPKRIGCNAISCSCKNRVTVRLQRTRAWWASFNEVLSNSGEWCFDPPIY